MVDIHGLPGQTQVFIAKTEEQEETQKILKNRGYEVDTTVSIGHLTYIHAYNSPENSPRLPTPRSDVSSETQTQQQQTPSEPSLAMTYAQKLSEILEGENLTDEQIEKWNDFQMFGIMDPALEEVLGQINEELGETFSNHANKVKERGNQAVQNGKAAIGTLKEQVPNLPPALRELLNSTESQLETLQGELQSLTPPVTQQDIDEKVAHLKEQIANLKKSLDEFETNDPILGMKVAALKEQIIGELSHVTHRASITGDVSQTNLQYTQAQVNNALEEALEGLPEEQANQLRFAFHFPANAKSTDAEKILNQVAEKVGLSPEFIRNNLIDSSKFMGTLINQLETGSMSELKALYGIQGSFSIPESGTAQVTHHGEFMRNFEMKIRGLTPEQAQAVRAALADPLNPNISVETKNLIENLYARTVAAIKAEYNLPTNWSPSINVFTDLANPSVNTQAIWSTYSAMEEVANSFKLYIAAKGPDDPDSPALLNILKVVTEAISKLKELVALTMIRDGELTARLSKAQHEANMDKLNAQMKQLEEQRANQADMAEQQKKAEGWQKAQPFLDVMGWLGAIFLTLTAGPVGLALLGAKVMEKVDSNLSLSKGIEAIQDGVKNSLIAQGWEEDDANALASFTSCVVLTASTVAMGGSVNVTAMTEVLSQSQVVSTTLEGYSTIDEETAMWVGLGVDLAFTVAEFIGGIAMGSSVTKAMEMPAKIGKITLKMRKALEKVKILNKIMSKSTEKLAENIEKFESTVDRINTLRKILKGMESAGSKGTEPYLKIQDQLMDLGKEASELSTKIYNKSLLLVPAIVTTLSQASAAIIQGGTSFIHADISELRAALERKMAELDELIEIIGGQIKVLKQILEGMYSSLEGLEQFMESIGEGQEKKWAGLSQTASQIGNALQG